MKNIPNPVPDLIKASEKELGKITQHWKSRLFVGVLMLLMALGGLVIIDIGPQNSWIYWHIMVIGYAVLSLGLSWYLQHKNIKFGISTLGQELFHWLGLVLAVYLVSLLVSTGILSRVQAGFVVLLLLALAMYLAGIYIDRSFILISITLGVFIIVGALLEAYLSVIMVPVIIVAIILLIWWVRRDRPRQP
ncbi:MAG TPA: hypothetical protein VD770_01175 [Coxiellaceae bacterium]|nr:hypothetical protein [Coxiellaceae bacterium]